MYRYNVPDLLPKYLKKKLFSDTSLTHETVEVENVK